MDCSAGPGRTVETSGVLAPDGSVLAMVATSDDDHIKGGHDCESTYSIRVTRPGKPVESVDLGVVSIDRYGRRLEVRAEGFSQDGRQFFGLVCEGGSPILGRGGEKKRYRKPGVNGMLAAYMLADGNVSIFELDKLVPYADGCGAEVLQVPGVTPDGKAVLRLRAEGVTRLWAIEMESMKAVALPKDTKFIPLNPGGPQ